MERYLSAGFVQHLRDERQMLFVSGPRQVGKTTLARGLVDAIGAGTYLNWDNVDHRQQILAGVQSMATAAGAERLTSSRPVLALDELHKFRDWRNLLKGLFDQYEEALGIVVTGSAALDVWRRGGDSLMGRYFPYTLHPLSVGELTRADFAQSIEREPEPIDEAAWQALQRFGGFPEPYLRADGRFHNRWRRLRTEQLFRDDIRDLTRIQELDQLELLARLLATNVGQLTNQSWLSRQTRVAVDTVRRWLATLEAFYFCFPVRPWHRNVARALRKEPKYYLWDWTQATAEGARAENLVASALLKSVHGWTQAGLGDFGLYFVRDKEGHEVDFLVTRDGDPWFLVEVKRSEREALSPALDRFQRQTGAAHAFQVALDAEFVAADCFARKTPVIVPARTLLAQIW